MYVERVGLVFFSLCLPVNRFENVKSFLTYNFLMYMAVSLNLCIHNCCLLKSLRMRNSLLLNNWFFCLVCNVEFVKSYQPLQDKHYLVLNHRKYSKAIPVYLVYLYIHIQKKYSLFLAVLNKFGTRTLKHGTSLVPILLLHVQSRQLFYFAADILIVTFKKGPNDPTSLPVSWDQALRDSQKGWSLAELNIIWTFWMVEQELLLDH